MEILSSAIIATLIIGVILLLLKPNKRIKNKELDMLRKEFEEKTGKTFTDEEFEEIKNKLNS